MDAPSLAVVFPSGRCRRCGRSSPSSGGRYTTSPWSCPWRRWCPSCCRIRRRCTTPDALLPAGDERQARDASPCRWRRVPCVRQGRSPGEPAVAETSCIWSPSGFYARHAPRAAVPHVEAVCEQAVMAVMPRSLFRCGAACVPCACRTRRPVLSAGKRRHGRPPCGASSRPRPRNFPPCGHSSSVRHGPASPRTPGIGYHARLHSSGSGDGKPKSVPS